jgi:hypothetical protein
MPDGTTTSGETPFRPNPLPPSQLIEKYIQLRDKIKQVKDAQKQQLEPYNAALARLESLLLSALHDSGVENMRAKSGTVYKAVQTSATVRDWNLTLDYIRANELWELLDRRVSKVAVAAVIEERCEDIPGVEVTQAVALHVRRAG